MSKAKLGKSADDIFSRQTRLEENIIKEDETSKQTRGRPIEHKESWSKITVVLLDKQIHWLDQLASNIRLKTKVAISRAELIRAVIAALEESGLDFSELSNETSIKNFILEKLEK